MTIHKLFKISFFKNLGSTFTLTTVKSLLPIILIPKFINSWGDVVYAEWLFVMSVLGFISLFDFGLNNYGPNKIHYYRSSLKKSYTIVRDLIITLNFFLFVFCLLIFPLILICITYVIEFNSSLNLYLILLFFIIISNISGFFNSLFRVFNKQYIGNLFNIVYTILIFTGTYIALDKGKDAIFVACIMLVCSLVFVFLTIFVQYKYFRNSFKFVVNKKYFYLVFLKSIHFQFIKLSSLIKNNSPIILLQNFASPLLLITYSLHRTLSNALSQVVLLLNNALWQDITRNNAIKKNKLVQSVYLTQQLFVVVFGVTFSLILYIWYVPIMKLWLGSNPLLYTNKPILILFLIMNFIFVYWNSGSIFLVSVNRHEFLAKLSFKYSFFSFFVSFIGLIFFNLSGLLIGIILVEILYGILFIQKYILNSLNMDFSYIAKNIFLGIFLIIVQLFIVYLFDNKFFSTSLILIFTFLICFFTIRKLIYSDDVAQFLKEKNV